MSSDDNNCGRQCQGSMVNGGGWRMLDDHIGGGVMEGARWQY